MCKLLLFLLLFFLSIPTALAGNELVYFIGSNSPLGAQHVYTYNPATNVTSIIYTAPSNLQLINLAVDSHGNYYVTTQSVVYPYSSSILRNGNVLLQTPLLRTSILSENFWDVFVDHNDILYYSKGSWSFPSVVGSIYRFGSSQPLYTTPSPYIIGGFALDSKGNFYAPVTHAYYPSQNLNFFMKNGVRQLYNIGEICESGTFGTIQDNIYYTCSYTDISFPSLGATRVYKYNTLTKQNSLVEQYLDSNQIGLAGYAVNTAGDVYAVEVDMNHSYSSPSVLKRNGAIVFNFYGGGSAAVHAEIPVVLVHGIYSNDAIWNQVENTLESPPYNKDVYRVGELLGQEGLVPNNGNIISLAHQLELALVNLGAGKVDIVTHSMGGLVTRQYISSNRYSNNIRKLVMLGTPNEGAPIANNFYGGLWGAIGGQDPSDIARHQMIPRSPFLTALNSNFYSYRVTMDSFAGTRLNPIVLAPPILQLSYTPIIGPDAPTDSIVPVWSVNIPNSNCYETDVVHATGLGAFFWNAYYTDSQTIAATGSLLNNGSISLPSCRTTLDGLSPGTSLQTLLFTNTTAPSQEQIILQNFPLGTMFASVINWSTTAGNLSLEFISPSGVIVNASTYSQYPSTQHTYFLDQNSSLEYFLFEQPEQGLWSVRVSGHGLTTPTDYTLQLLMNKDISLEVFTDQTIYTPQSLFVITARVSNVTQPVLNTNVAATITKPDISQSLITLFDDGLHQDGAAQDGLYGNVYTATSLFGTYLIDVTASQPNNFTLSFSTAVFTELHTDIELQNTDIQLTPSQLALGQNATVQVQATIHNAGQKDATNVLVEFYDGDPSQGGFFLGNATIITLPVNGSVQRAVSFQHLADSQPSRIIEGTANLSATLNISIADFGLRSHDIYVVAEGDDLDLNITNNIAHRKIGFGAVPYIVVLSLGDTPGTPLGDGRTIPLNYDGLFELSLYSSTLIGLTNSQGILNEQGEGFVTWTVPNLSFLVGLPFYVGFVTLDITQPFPGLIYSISPSQQIVIQP